MKAYFISFKISILGIIILLNGCQNNSTPTIDAISQDTTQQESLAGNWIRSIFYNIPSPVEMANIIQKANVIYNQDVLSEFGRENNLLTQEYQALNLGVYGADFSYCTVFEQLQESFKYLNSIKQLTVMLQIPPDESNKVVKKLEQNMQNRDSLITVVTDMFLNADLYLKENRREGTAILILLGSWVEGMYIATHITDQNDPYLNERIAEQKFSFYNIFSLFETHKRNTTLTKQIYTKLTEIKSTYDKVVIKSGNVEVEVLSEYKKAILKSKGEVSMPEPVRAQIKQQLSSLRTMIVNKK